MSFLATLVNELGSIAEVSVNAAVAANANKPTRRSSSNGGGGSKAAESCTPCAIAARVEAAKNFGKPVPVAKAARKR